MEDKVIVSLVCRIQYHYWLICPILSKLMMGMISAISYGVVNPFLFNTFKYVKFFGILCLTCYILPIFLSIPEENTLVSAAHLPLCHPYSRSTMHMSFIIAGIYFLLSSLIICVTIISYRVLHKVKKESGRQLYTNDEKIFIARLYAHMFIAILTDSVLFLFLYFMSDSEGNDFEQIMPMILSLGPILQMLVTNCLRHYSTI